MAGRILHGILQVEFFTSHGNRIPTYELMDRGRERSPRAWSLQRDFWMTGMEHRPKFLPGNLPNIVRERETRRITVIEKQKVAAVTGDNLLSMCHQECSRTLASMRRADRAR